LNARTVGSSTEKGGAQRPGLFQRGSSSNNIPTTALSPTLFSSSRERERTGTGIQGGVLSGVAGPPAARKRKDSELGAGESTENSLGCGDHNSTMLTPLFLMFEDSLRSPRTPFDAEHHWDQRKTNDAFTSARNRNTRTVHDEGFGNAGLTSSNGEMIETWSKFGGRRERAPGEGPIGPPADHSGGFAKFSGYDRKVSAEI
jgi:PERQ amino acid-rich with GYF domain-containing protein